MQVLSLTLLSMLATCAAIWIANKHCDGIQAERPKISEANLQFDRTRRQCQYVESELLKIRKSGIPSNTTLLPIDWQHLALTGNSSEFAILLCVEVWGKEGQQFYQYRLNKFMASPMVYWDVVDFVSAQQYAA